jgi:hypothetical protein
MGSGEGRFKGSLDRTDEDWRLGSTMDLSSLMGLVRSNCKDGSFMSLLGVGYLRSV